MKFTSKMDVDQEMRVLRDARRVVIDTNNDLRGHAYSDSLRIRNLLMPEVVRLNALEKSLTQLIDSKDY